MGISDIIPGVSGGTIALILGIYERFISALGNLNLMFASNYLRFLRTGKTHYQRKSISDFRRMDLFFLIMLGAGIAAAIIAGSFMIPYLMESFPVVMFAFFAGLILSSAVSIYKKRVNQVNAFSLLYVLIGLVFGFLIASATRLQASHDLPVLFISAMLAICAMLLPGVSGSFVLLMLGQYSYALSLLKSPIENWLRIGVMVLGGIVGLLLMSKAIKYLLEMHHDRTLLFLVGLMLGSIKLIYDNVTAASPGTLMISLGVVSFLLGAGIVQLLNR